MPTIRGPATASRRSKRPSRASAEPFLAQDHALSLHRRVKGLCAGSIGAFGKRDPVRAGTVSIVRRDAEIQSAVPSNSVPIMVLQLDNSKLQHIAPDQVIEIEKSLALRAGDKRSPARGADAAMRRGGPGRMSLRQALWRIDLPCVACVSGGPLCDAPARRQSRGRTIAGSEAVRRRLRPGKPDEQHLRDGACRTGADEPVALRARVQGVVRRDALSLRHAGAHRRGEGHARKHQAVTRARSRWHSALRARATS